MDLALYFYFYVFHFTPSAVVNIVAGLSKINIFQYILAVVAGKMVMIFIVSFVGYDFGLSHQESFKNSRCISNNFSPLVYWKTNRGKTGEWIVKKMEKKEQRG